MRVATSVGLFLGVCLSISSARADDWETVAKEHGLTDPDLKLLRANRFVITGQEFKQVFTPYIRSKVPVFVTPDSLMSAYHVLLEESVVRMEQAHAKKLPAILDRIATNLDGAATALTGDKDLVRSAKLRAAIFVGTARALLDDKAVPTDPVVKTVVAEEVKRVVAATGLRSSWPSAKNGSRWSNTSCGRTGRRWWSA
jgi:hypothetical protein